MNSILITTRLQSLVLRGDSVSARTLATYLLAIDINH